MSERMSTMMSRFGNRDMFALGNLVLRPDGSMFVQGDLSTYRRTVLPVGLDTIRPEHEELRLLGLDARGPTLGRQRPSQTAGSPSILGTGTPGSIDEAVHYEPVPSRTVVRALWVDRVFLGPGGQEVTLRRLRRSRQMPGNCDARHTEERQIGRQIVRIA